MTVERGCGFRTKGGIYAEVPTSPWGSPLEAFLVDPTLPIVPSKFGLTPVNMRVFQRDGIYHIIDWIGAQHYPTAVHWLEEVRRFGVSTKLSLSADELKLLGPGSCIFPVHGFAYFDPRDAHYADLQNLQNLGYSWKHCPTGKHPKPDGSMCVGLLWQNLPAVPERESVESVLPYRAHHYKMPSFEFAGYEQPGDFENVPDNYQPAIFARFPITRLIMIRDDDETNAANLKKLTGSKLFDPDQNVLDE